MPDVPAAILTLAAAFDGFAHGPAPFLLAGLALLLAGAATWAAVVVWTARAIHQPPRMTGGRAWARLGRTTPGELGLAFEDERYDVADAAVPGGRISLVAWWIATPAAAGRTCVLLHGYGDSRAGSLAWAGVWRELGFNLLLPDARAHGDSGGDLAGGGVLERDDLHRLLDAFRVKRPEACRRGLVLFAVSYGGLSAAACAAGRDDLSALVLDSPIADWPDVTRRYACLLGLPLDHAHPLRMRLMEWWTNTRFAEVRSAATLAETRCPTLLILPRHDPLLAAADADELARIVEINGEAWRPDVAHNLALAADPRAYLDRLAAFLERAGLRATHGSSSSSQNW